MRPEPLPLENVLPSRFQGPLVGTAPPYFIAGTKAWVWVSMLMAALAMTLLGLGFVTLRILDGRADAAEWMMGLFLLPFLIVLCLPRTWGRPIWLVADRTGLHFFGSSIEAGSVYVPWREIGEEMVIERISTGNGLTRGIVFQIAGSSPFWDRATNSRFLRHLLQPVQADGFRRLPLTGFGHSLPRSLAALRHLRAEAVTAPASPAN